MSDAGLGWDAHRRRHVLPGRLFLAVDGLERNPDACSLVMSRLYGHPAIEYVMARPLTGRVLVRFNAAHVCADAIEEMIAACTRGAEAVATLDVQPMVGGKAAVNGARRRAEVRRGSLRSGEQARSSAQQNTVDDWHAISLSEIGARLQTRLPRGLRVEEAMQRLELFGPNRLQAREKPNLTKVILRKLGNPITLLLIGTGGVSLVVAQWLEALAALGIAAMTTFIGVRQELQAANALEPLEELAAPHATVRRDGRWETVAAEDVVPGDMVTLEAGDRVPADARIVFSAGFQVDESALTGESYPVLKDANAQAGPKTPLAERGNMVYAGTTVVSGRARVVVVATGMASQVGWLAAQLGSEGRDTTPLQRRLQRLARAIFWAILGLAAVGTMASVVQGVPIGVAIARAASVAVTAMPHGLPMTVTIALSIAVARLARHGAIARQLAAMESLGATSVICSDKTGTLTCNELVVKNIVTGVSVWSVTGEGFTPEGDFLLEDVVTEPDESVLELLTTAALCSDADLVAEEDRWRVEGDATEGALLVAGVKAGLDVKALRHGNRRLHEVPFSAETRRMTTVCETDDGVLAIVKGAPENVISLCKYVAGAEGEQKLTLGMRTKWLEQAGRLAEQGQRVLAVARRTHEGPAESPVEDEFVLLGLAGMVDAPRPGVAEAVARCRRAGIRVLMLTGDHPATATVIARELGILADDGIVLTGTEVDELTDTELGGRLAHLAVGARLAPEHKLRIVRLLKKQGEIVVMTGDGVNDAPALQIADVGIAMGLAGTEVTKGAASLVLTNDDFSSIVAAVESGRAAYDNIRRSLTYSLGTNGGEALMALIPLLLGMPLPIPVAALLLSNMLCDGPVSLSLATDTSRRGLMHLTPRPAGDAVFNRREITSIVTRAVKIGLTTVGLYWVGMAMTATPAIAYSMSLAGLVAMKLTFAYKLRRLPTDGTARHVNQPNRLLTAATATGIGLTVVSMYVPGVAGIFGLAPLGLMPLAAVAAAVWAQDGIGDVLRLATGLRSVRIRRSLGAREGAFA